MKRFETLCALFGWFAVACGGETADAGTNTNWLVACNDTSDCEEGVCACGVCTRECGAAADCAEIRGTSCLSGETLGCDHEARLCLEPCDEGDECGGDRRCTGELCTESASNPVGEDAEAPSSSLPISTGNSTDAPNGTPDTDSGTAEAPRPESGDSIDPDASVTPAPNGSSVESDAGVSSEPDASEPVEPEPLLSAGDASTSPETDAGSAEPQERVPNGFPCGPLALGTSLTDCIPGEICIDCDNATNLVPRMCAPNPETDPEGFATETANCGAALLTYECDGPEDCDTGERCIADPQGPMNVLTDYRYGKCSSDSPPCEPDGNCVVCHDDADCDPGVQCAPRTQGAGWPGRTCGEGLADLLTEGAWVAGAPDAVDRYSWLSFTPDADGASTGTLVILDAECDACVGPFLPCEGQGRYSVLGGTGVVEVESPSDCGELDGLSSWSFHTVQTEPPGYPPVALLSYLVDGGGMEMELHLRSPSYCNAEFTSCVLPDDL